MVGSSLVRLCGDSVPGRRLWCTKVDGGVVGYVGWEVTSAGSVPWDVDIKQKASCNGKESIAGGFEVEYLC